MNTQHRFPIGSPWSADGRSSEQPCPRSRHAAAGAGLTMINYRPRTWV